MVKQFKDAEKAVVVYGAFVLASPEAARAAEAFAKAVGAKTMIMGPMANSYGLEATGVLPDQGEAAYPDMLQDAKALLVSNLDPAQDGSVAERLRGLELLVVHDLFPSATTELAHVVLPAKSGYEKDGTVVNLEGRYLKVNSSPVDSGQSEDFTGVVKRLGEALGTRLEGRSVRSARRLLKKNLDTDLAELPDEGTIMAAKPRKLDKASGEEAGGGNTLLVPSMLRTEYLSRNPHLAAAHGEAALKIRPADAVLYDLREGDVVSMKVGGVRRRLWVEYSEAMPGGTFLVPALPEQPVGVARADLASAVKERRVLEVA